MGKRVTYIALAIFWSSLTLMTSYGYSATASCPGSPFKSLEPDIKDGNTIKRKCQTADRAKADKDYSVNKNYGSLCLETYFEIKQVAEKVCAKMDETEKQIAALKAGCNGQEMQSTYSSCVSSYQTKAKEARASLVKELDDATNKVRTLLTKNDEVLNKYDQDDQNMKANLSSPQFANSQTPDFRVSEGQIPATYKDYSQAIGPLKAEQTQAKSFAQKALSQISSAKSIYSGDLATLDKVSSLNTSNSQGLGNLSKDTSNISGQSPAPSSPNNTMGNLTAGLGAATSAAGLAAMANQQQNSGSSTDTGSSTLPNSTGYVAPASPTNTDLGNNGAQSNLGTNQNSNSAKTSGTGKDGLVNGTVFGKGTSSGDEGGSRELASGSSSIGGSSIGATNLNAANAAAVSAPSQSDYGKGGSTSVSKKDSSTSKVAAATPASSKEETLALGSGSLGAGAMGTEQADLGGIPDLAAEMSLDDKFKLDNKNLTAEERAALNLPFDEDDADIDSLLAKQAARAVLGADTESLYKRVKTTLVRAQEKGLVRSTGLRYKLNPKI